MVTPRLIFLSPIAHVALLVLRAQRTGFLVPASYHLRPEVHPSLLADVRDFVAERDAANDATIAEENVRRHGGIAMPQQA